MCTVARRARDAGKFSVLRGKREIIENQRSKRECWTLYYVGMRIISNSSVVFYPMKEKSYV